MEEEKKKNQSQPLEVFQRLITFIMRHSFIARSIANHLPKPQGASTNEGMVSTADQQQQQSLVPKWSNGVESERGYLQKMHRHTPHDKSCVEIQVHYKKIDGDDDDDSKIKNLQDDQEVKPIFTSVNASLPNVDEEDVRLKTPSLRRTTRPSYSFAPNINEKSDEFIRSRKEAMRRSQSFELPPTKI